MSIIRSRHTLPVLTLLAALVVTPTLAQAREARPSRQARPTAAAASSSFLGNLGSAWHLLTSLWGASGMSIDPNGGKTTGDSGGSIDPWGKATSDSGMSIDPWG